MAKVVAKKSRKAAVIIRVTPNEKGYSKSIAREIKKRMHQKI